MADNNFIPHSDKQESIIFSDEELTVVGTGTQWGKSQSAALWIKRQIHTFTHPEDTFLLMAPTYKVMNQSMLPYFLRVMEGFGDYRQADGEFRVHNGGTVYLRTGKDPNSIIGIPKVRAFWLDEAGLATLYFWENILARAASKGARGLLTTSPYALNWIWKDIIKPATAGKLPAVKLIQAPSWENPYHDLHDPERREAMRSKMDPRRFQMIFGGEWGRMEGLVYDCWDDDRNYVEAFGLPTDTRFIGGIDWGYQDPFVIKIRAVTPDGRQYGISEFYKTGLTPVDQIEIGRQKHKIFGVQYFLADPSQPGMIEEFNRNGIPCRPANNDIDKGIGLHYELIKTGRYKEFSGTCPHSAEEREVYHYPEPKDLGPDQQQKAIKPVDQSNHCMDVDRYITMDTYQAHHRNPPKVPKSPDQLKSQDRFKYLTRKNRNGNTESWG